MPVYYTHTRGYALVSASAIMITTKQEKQASDPTQNDLCDYAPGFIIRILAIAVGLKLTSNMPLLGREHHQHESLDEVAGPEVVDVIVLEDDVEHLQLAAAHHVESVSGDRARGHCG